MGRSTRRELLEAVSEHVRRTGDSTLPWCEVDGLADEFGSPDEVLRALHRRWYARFFARLDELLEDPPADLARAVAVLWDELTSEDPARRAILDAYRGHPTLIAAEERQRQLLALATGGASHASPDGHGQLQTRRAVLATSSSSHVSTGARPKSSGSLRGDPRVGAKANPTESGGRSRVLRRVV